MTSTDEGLKKYEKWTLKKCFWHNDENQQLKGAFGCRSCKIYEVMTSRLNHYSAMALQGQF